MSIRSCFVSDQNSSSFLVATNANSMLDSGLLELSLDLNSTASLPPHLRFNLASDTHDSSSRRLSVPRMVDPDTTPEHANAILSDYTQAVRTAQVPPTQLHTVRMQVEEALGRAEGGTEALADLESRVDHAVARGRDGLVGQDEALEDDTTFLSPEQETEYLSQLDKSLEGGYSNISDTATTPVARNGNASADLDSTLVASSNGEKHFANLTPREQQRQSELMNPQSQHNWLKHHTKIPTPHLPEDVDNDSLASGQDNNGAGSSAGKPRKRPSGVNKNLAKQVGDRAFERASRLEGAAGASPSGASGIEEDEFGPLDDMTGTSGSGRKKAKDPDGTYRLKGGKGGGSSKGKRKRSAGLEEAGEDTGVKKPKIEEEAPV